MILFYPKGIISLESHESCNHDYHVDIVIYCVANDIVQLMIVSLAA